MLPVSLVSRFSWKPVSGFRLQACNSSWRDRSRRQEQMRSKIGIGIGVLTLSWLAAGCTGDPAHAAEETEAAVVVAADPAAPVSTISHAAVTAETYESIADYTQSVDSKLRK